MNCRRAKKLVFEFVDGLADESARLDLEKHLAECGECEKLASQLTRSMDLIHRAPVETLDENFNWKVRLGIHKERQAMHDAVASQGALFRTWNLRYGASAVAGFVVVVAVGWMAFSAGIVSVGGGSEATLATPGPVAERSEAALEPAKEAEADMAEAKKSVQQPSGPIFTDHSAGSPVSLGAANRGRVTSAKRGPIEASSAPVNMDSLVQAEMMNLSDEERAKYLNDRIMILEKYRNKKPE
jgi:hypothetical protein